MKTREQIITSMCYTWRHDYGLEKTIGTGYADIISSGMTVHERQALWNQMAQVFDHCIAPVMQPKTSYNYNHTDWIEP